MPKSKTRYRTWNREKEKKYNRSNYIVVIVIVLMICIAYIFISQGINYKENIIPVYNYAVQKNSNYEVLLKPNTFYETKTLPSGRYYASQSINLYKINFEYDFKGDKKTNFDCTYNIIANLIGTVKENDGQEKEVWNRKTTFNENTCKKYINTDEFIIKKGVNIDYEYYNNLARSYEKTYGIIIDSVLKLKFNISYTIETSNFKAETQKIEDSIELEIPITNTVSEIKENYEKKLENSINLPTDNIQVQQIIYYIIGGALILGAIILIIIEIIIKNKKEREQMYNYNINHILKYYKDLIVTVTNMPDLKDLKVMKVLALEDLLDLAEQNQVNIIHYKIPNKEESNLYVILSNYVYIYIVTEDQLK